MPFQIWKRFRTLPEPDKLVVSTPNWSPVKIEGTWVPSEVERRASWDLYIELITRISIIELPPDQGILREALTSLHVLFVKTREILHIYGPDVALTTDDNDNLSFGFISIIVLNYILRPFLTKWHPELLDWEIQREAPISLFEHEKKWKHNHLFREELEIIRIILIEYARLLANTAKVPPSILEPTSSTSDKIPPTVLNDEKLTFYSRQKSKKN